MHYLIILYRIVSYHITICQKRYVLLYPMIMIWCVLPKRHGADRALPVNTPNLPTNIVGFGALDSSTMLI